METECPVCSTPVKDKQDHFVTIHYDTRRGMVLADPHWHCPPPADCELRKKAKKARVKDGYPSIALGQW